MKPSEKGCQEILMQGRTDDGRFGRGAFFDWVAEAPLLYGTKHLVRPDEAASLLPTGRQPLVLEEYGQLFISRALAGALTLCAGVASIPPHHPCMPLRRQNCEEALYVVAGAGIVEVEGETHCFSEGDAVFLPAWTAHRIENTGAGDLVLLFFKGVVLAPHEGLGEIQTESGFAPLPPSGPLEDSGRVTTRAWKYWTKIVVSEQDRLPHYTHDGQIAESPGQQGFQYISPANVNTFTLRLVGGSGPAARLSRGTDRYEGWTVSWHDTEEVHYCLEGEGVLLVNGKKVPFRKGDMTFAPARSIHRIFPNDETYREMCATGIRFRPFEGLTESAIDQREYRMG